MNVSKIIESHISRVLKLLVLQGATLTLKKYFSFKDFSYISTTAII